MNILKTISTFMILVYTNVLFASECESVPVSEKGLISTKLSVTGSRGTLNITAFIDTGASLSVIPRSVADGISYESEKKSQYQTVAGRTELKSILVNKLEFLGAEFSDVTVAISEPVTPLKYDYIKFDPVTNAIIHPNKNMPKEMPELSVIGMAELSKVNFYFEDGDFTVCQK